MKYFNRRPHETVWLNDGTKWHALISIFVMDVNSRRSYSENISLYCTEGTYNLNPCSVKNKLLNDMQTQRTCHS
jgi:hypothetical protein